MQIEWNTKPKQSLFKMSHFPFYNIPLKRIPASLFCCKQYLCCPNSQQLFNQPLQLGHLKFMTEYLYVAGNAKQPTP